MLLNLGVISRVLLVVVKPICLLASLQLDSDSGVKLAQIYLIGVLFVSLTGTNAHKIFYETKFGEKQSNAINIASNYKNYLINITLQVLLVTIIIAIASSFIFIDTLEVVMLGIIFGIAEKINDEYQRYAQFCNDSIKLFKLACSKLLACTLAVGLTYIQLTQIWIAFPLILLLGAYLVNKNSLDLCAKYIAVSANISIIKLINNAFLHIRNDATQIGWVFTTMSLMSVDKWLVQYLSVDYLPKYTLLTQFASIAMVAQTIFLIAPVRVRLINEHPNKIKSLRIGTPLIALILIVCGLVLVFSDILKAEDANIGYFAFFIAALFTLKNAHTERLYWVVDVVHRIALDIFIFILLAALITLVLVFTESPDNISWCLGSLLFLLCIRYSVMGFLLRKKEDIRF